MGVHGLATYLKENKRHVARTAEFLGPHSDASRTTLVIDAWSFIYKLVYDSFLPWVYGGEYALFSGAVRRVVDAWLQLGLEPHFVFDGSVKPEKFATCVDRLVRTPVQNSLLYFRTSTVARSSPRFLNETRLPPPFVYNACVQTLQAMDGVGVYFADDEADAYAVELAGRLGGYVVGQDSDFAVLNSTGYLGYIPLEEMLWVASGAGAGTDAGAPADDDGEFQVVRKAKRKKPIAVVAVASSKQAVGRGIIPPDSLENVSLQASVYEPSVLAQHFKLPTSLLPLLGALVGNDYTPPSHRSLLFERRLTVSQRISHAAATLEGFIHPKVAPHKKPRMPNSVLHLIELTVERLVNTSYAPANMIGSVAQAEIVNQIVDATLPYAIKHNDGDVDDLICPLHPPSDCTLFYALSSVKDLENPHHPAIISQYLAAYRAGKIAPKVMDVFTTATYWPRLFLEDPDMESTPRSISRYIRVFMYAILEQTLGIPAAQFDDDGIDTDTDIDPGQQEAKDGEDDDDELVDVEEWDDEQDVEHLRDQLRDLSFDMDEDGETDDMDCGGSVSVSHPSEPASSLSLAYSRRSTGPKVVSEYVRKGSRVIAEEVDVPTDLPSFASPPQDVADGTDVPLPLPLQPEDKRFTAFLKFLHSDTQPVRSLHADNLLSVLALRTVICRLHERAEDAPTSRERLREKWTRNEAKAFLASFADSSQMLANPSPAGERPDDSPASSAPPPVSPRAVQLFAQTSSTIESILHLSQVLFLTDRVPSCILRFSGQKFHAFVAGDPKAIPEHEAWPAVLDGLSEGCFLEATEKKGERKKRKGQATQMNTTESSGGARNLKAASGKGAGASTKNIFALLGDANL